MKSNRIAAFRGALVLALAMGSLNSCGTNQAAEGLASRQTGEKGEKHSSSPLDIFRRSGPKVPGGTTLSVRLGQTISSEHASAGDAWSGEVTRDVVVEDRVVIPAGSPVSGVVAAAREAQRGNRAMLDLSVRSVQVGGKRTPVSAGTEAVIAGSPRARNLGAIAGGAAAGALIGKAVGGDGKDAAVGGILGGATAAGVVAASKGYQVVLKEGTVLRFTVNEPVAMK